MTTIHNEWEERDLLAAWKDACVEIEKKYVITGVTPTWAFHWWEQKMRQAIASSTTEYKNRLKEGVEEIGSQQDDDTIWCNMDDVLKLIDETV